ncbi:phage portal protein [Thermomonas carbonis]|uniref:Phage portal protein n=1 Tax=Thermomonas carbonis TaxID=1463158 RepID=A0A7G9SR84_9GAMM|nr:phage portal protein [Thermomonas carbonis]QNN70359.1 phage portal protein [Thermomonas carbonis]GHB99498.1 hypothetical protein GCM10010080_10420 [Thermomonas carbonis]
MGIVDRFRGFLSREKAAPALVPVSTPRMGTGWFPLVTEPYAGAWQQGVTGERAENVTGYSTVYACLSRIAKDIGKLPFTLRELDANGLWRETTNPAYSPVLRRPNHYQTAAQFRESWILSKLQHGNAYILKRRDLRGVVDGLFILDPTKVKALVSDTGDVFYELSVDNLNHLSENGRIIVPAREMIHDREVTLYHPLIGVPPLLAAYWPAVKNQRINRTGAEFFGNHAQPGGVLTAPAGMSEPDALKLQQFWQQNYTGSNAGKIAVIGADLKYQGFANNAADSQLVEQLKYSDEQICHAFGVPPYKIGIGHLPTGLKVGDVSQVYYQDALQARIESMEDCLDHGLGLGDAIGVELNLEPLLRMDAQQQAEIEGALVKNGIKAPNEARRRFGLKPLEGGDSVYLQMQNFSLQALARRDQSADPFGTGTGKDAGPLLTRGQANYIQKVMEGRDPKMRARFNNTTQRWETLAGSGEWNPASWRWTQEHEARWAA